MDPFTARGTAWLDSNEDGRRQPWETALTGISVTLGLTRTTTTDRDGRFQFLAVPTGTHTLEASLPPGWEADIPPIIISLRGAAVGIAAHPSAPEGGTSYLYLPLLIGPERFAPEQTRDADVPPWDTLSGRALHNLEMREF